MFEPALVEPQEMTRWVAIVQLNLLTDQFLQELVPLMLLPTHFYLLYIVEYPLQPVQADVARVVPVMPSQVLLDLVVLLQPQSTVRVL